MTTESVLQSQIRRALGIVPGLCLWRNTTGHTVEFDARGQARHIRYGLAPGSADLVGLLDGRFIALEVKTATGRVSADQETWLECVRCNGGFAAIVRSVDEAVAAIARARGGASS